jgi:hypothetical protein
MPSPIQAFNLPTFPGKIRDKQGRRPNHPDYDARTVKVPDSVMAKLSGTQKEYWKTKQDYMDIVLFFKVGSFYELYELDAEIGIKEFGWKLTLSGVGKCRQVSIRTLWIVGYLVCSFWFLLGLGLNVQVYKQRDQRLWFFTADVHICRKRRRLPSCRICTLIRPHQVT